MYNKRGDKIKELEHIIKIFKEKEASRTDAKSESKKDQLIEELKQELCQAHKKLVDVHDKLNKHR